MKVFFKILPGAMAYLKVFNFAQYYSPRTLTHTLILMLKNNESAEIMYDFQQLCFKIPWVREFKIQVRTKVSTVLREFNPGIRYEIPPQARN